MYKDISLEEKKQLEDTLLQTHQDQYQWFLAITLICLLLEMFFPDRKIRENKVWEGRIQA